ncbi:hypothetical protein ABIB73_003414 [Bradyrhizobium sp. F1.4.3]|uniref:hypothetical protein n=1 Tax=Bradyrhizobium sp. F1.4.3 TaxID=3156356 RepID=UPI0033965D9C
MAAQHSRLIAFSQLLAIFEMLLFIAAGLSAIAACLIGSHPAGGREAFFALAGLAAGGEAALDVLRRLVARRGEATR